MLAINLKTQLNSIADNLKVLKAVKKRLLRQQKHHLDNIERLTGIDRTTEEEILYFDTDPKLAKTNKEIDELQSQYDALKIQYSATFDYSLSDHYSSADQSTANKTKKRVHTTLMNRSLSAIQSLRTELGDAFLSYFFSENACHWNGLHIIARYQGLDVFKYISGLIKRDFRLIDVLALLTVTTEGHTPLSLLSKNPFKDELGGAIELAFHNDLYAFLFPRTLTWCADSTSLFQPQALTQAYIESYLYHNHQKSLVSLTNRDASLFPKKMNFSDDCSGDDSLVGKITSLSLYKSTIGKFLLFGYEERLCRLLSLPQVRSTLTHLRFSNINFEKRLSSALSTIANLSQLKYLAFENAEIKNTDAWDIVEAVTSLNLTTLSLAHNFIDLIALRHSCPAFRTATRVNLSGNGIQINGSNIQMSGITALLTQHIPNCVITPQQQITSYLNPDLIVTQDKWLVYLLASQTTLSPSHCSVAIEGLNDEGVHILMGAHLVPKDLPCYSATGIFFSMMTNVSASVKYLREDILKNKVIDLKNNNIFFGFYLSSDHARSLIQTIQKDIEQLDARFNILPTANINELTCLRWVLTRVNEYRILEEMPLLTGERPYATVLKYLERSHDNQSCEWVTSMKDSFQPRRLNQ